jgi:hypothetical protein
MELGVAFGASALMGGLLPKIGLMAAGVALQFLFSSKKQQYVQRLSDLKVSSSSYGRGITICYGSWRCTGNMFWATDIEEVKHIVGKKGKEKGDGKKGNKKVGKGQAQVVYKYYANFAMGLCEGTSNVSGNDVGFNDGTYNPNSQTLISGLLGMFGLGDPNRETRTGAPIAGLLRIWADSNCIYNQLNNQGGYDSQGVWFDQGYYDDHGVFHPVVNIGFSQESANSGGKKGASANKKADNADSGAFQFRFYGGGEEQAKDPFMVARSGDANTPAYRGMCYLFFEHMPLMDFGNRIPTITAEVTTDLVRNPIISMFEPISGDYFGIPEVDAGAGILGSVPALSGDMRAVIDPARGLLCQVISWSHPTKALVYGVRTWDFIQEKEISRFETGSFLSGMPFPPGPIFGPGGPVIGYTGNGTLAVGGEPYVDVNEPFTFQYFCQFIIEFDPVYGSSWDTGTYAVFPKQTVALVTPDDMGSMTAGTGFLSLGGGAGDVLPMNFPPDIGPEVGGVGAWLVAAGGGSAGTMFIRDGGFQKRARIWTADGGLLFDTPKLATHPVYWDQRGMGPVWSTGADMFIYLVFVSDNSGSGPAQGIWAFGLDATGNQVWLRHLTNDLNNTYFGLRCDIIPVLAGTRFMFLNYNGGGTQLITIDVRTGSFTIEELPDYNYDQHPGQKVVAKPVGPQWYLENLGGFVYWGMMYIGGVQKWGWYKLFPNKFEQQKVFASDIITDAAKRAGIDSTKLNFTFFNDKEITGFGIDNPTPARKIIEDLASLFFFDACESDGVIKFVSRGGASAVTITEDHLGIVGGESGGGNGPDDANACYEETRHQEIDLPQMVTVSFVDPKADFQLGSQIYRRPISPMSVMQSRENLDINVPVAMTNDDAAKMAETICIAAWNERVNHKYVLPVEYLALDPTDVITVHLDNGLTMVDRIIQQDVGANLAQDLQTVCQVQPYYTDVVVAENLHNPYDPVGTGAQPGSSISIPGLPDPVSQALVMDVPLLEDADASHIGGQWPVYWGAGAWGPGFSGAELQMKTSNTDWVGKGIVTADMPWGIVKNVVAAPPNGPYVQDDTTQIILAPRYDYDAALTYEWQTIEDDVWPNDSNMVVIGGEVILFKTVTLNDDHTVTLSNLIRGHRGTENWCNDHGVAEKFQIIQTGSTGIAEMDPTQLNAAITARLNTFSVFGNLNPAATFTFKANVMRPYAPNDIERSDDVSYNSTISWQRRTRYNGQMQDGTGTVPLNEESELYRVYIRTTTVDPLTFDPTDTTQYVRVLADVTTNSAVYTAAMKATDGVSNTQAFYAVVYQVSSSVGVGFPGVSKKLETDRPAYR